ncbi:MAG: phage tail tape measure protein [Lachnospiraceae bacterium]|nr:phage tail tape measure protein [Lachnospiraceae bacterium]
MSNSKEYRLAIKIAGEIDKSLQDSTGLTKKELREIAKQAALASDASGSAMKSFRKGLVDSEPFFTGLEGVARSTFKAMTEMAAVAGAGIMTGLGASIAVGSEFESAFAGVKKTVNATDAELLQMRDDIRQMAKEMPVSAAELSEIAEAAGQLGIHNENIAEFTKTMANMNVATDLGSDEAATEFAQFANIVRMSQDDFGRLGSTVVALGNNMATTESQTMSMGMRIAAAGDQVGLSEADIMAYSAALSSVGIEAEAGGTAFSKMLVNMQLASETEKDLQKYAKVAGMTGQEFKKAFQEDASTAINSFLSGLNNAEQNGKSAIAVLTDMGITESRLRDTLIRAANASDLFDDALDLSNEAWQENVALTNEAAQRYETLESQSGILKNNIKDLGISIYDDLRPGLTDAITLANEFVDGMAGQQDALSNMIKSAVKDMPTMAREMQETGKAIREFSEPFLEVGGWLADNPGVIVGTISGIGTALAGYKVASGVASLASALGALNPVGMGIMALGGAAGVIAGIGTAVKKSAAEAKRANLDRHFGNIALSMKELQEAASFIVQSESLDQVRESIAEMNELEGIADTIDDTVSELNKANWKISIGMELTEDERQAYIEQAKLLADETQEYLTQREYTTNLSLNSLLGDDLEKSNVVTQLHDFYQDKKGELARIGTELNQVITDAFADGLLDMDELKEITELQEQMANIKQGLADSNFESGLDLIGMKYAGVDLNADSFINLQAEIREQKEEALGLYDEAYVAAMSEYRLMLSEGEWSQEEFDAAKAELDMGYLEQKAGIQIRSSQFMTNTIKQAYGEEISDLMQQLQQETGLELHEMLNRVANGVSPNVHLDFVAEDVIDSIDIDQSTRDAMADLYEQMQPDLSLTQAIAKSYKDAGERIPDEIRQSLTDMSTIGALAGDVDAMWEMIELTAESAEYQKALNAINDAGGYMPEALANAIRDNQDLVTEAVMQSFADTVSVFNQTYGSWPISSMSLASVVSETNKMVTTGHADGGIFTVPHIAWFAEEGPEAAIPIDGSRNAIDLWLKTGELLGMDGIISDGNEIIAAPVSKEYSGGSGTVQIDYNPTLQFYGNAPGRDEIEDALETAQERFAQMMEQWMKDNKRIKFY